MITRSIFVLLAVYLLSAGLYFLVSPEGNYAAGLPRRLVRAAVFGLAPLCGLAFGYWWQQRRKPPLP